MSTPENISDALELLADNTIQDAETVRRNKKKSKRWRKWIAVAACIALVFGTGVSAEASSGAVSNLLAPLFGGAKAELVGNIGVPVDASVSADGYTLTADAIIGDRYNVAIVYTLSRDDGEAIPDGIYFAGWETDIMFAASAGGSLQVVRNEEHPDQIHLVESWSRSIPLIGRVATVSFSDLSLSSTTGEDDILLAQGPWKLTYTLRYKDSTVKVPVHDLSVNDEFGEEYTIKKILLSPIGLHLEIIAPVPERMGKDNVLMQNFHVSLLLSDGTNIALEANAGGSYTMGNKTADAHYAAMFDTPISLEEIEALILCDTTFPLNLS
ncbi:MAG: DUF4179 domain-containing protein [Intestinimonas sp.]|jgi:hypothetical protein|nr:DUF4179 domain-containing protein [Intestinimonas sp.]